MRKVMILLGLLMVGCASRQSAVVSNPSRQLGYVDKPASLMAFEHPAMAEMPVGFYNREVLAPGAFVAFEQPSLTVYQIQTDERQVADDGWMYRRTMSQQIGVSIR